MEITEVRIKLMDEAGERLQAFCSITFDDCFVIRDLKIIEGTNGPFVAMPSRKLTGRCQKCGAKNHLRANHCNECGAKQNTNRAVIDENGRAKLYADIAHPIHSACREMIQERVIQEFHQELERAKQPGYKSRYDDFDLDDFPAPRKKSADSHPTVNYTQPGSEPASRAERPEQALPAPHKTKAAQPAIATADGHKPQSEGTADANSATDAFGAGIL